MPAMIWAAALACAPMGWDDAPKEAAPATGRHAAVTVYRGRARVIREVPVPEGDGPIELTVGPLPPGMAAGSLFAEGTDGLRVISARVASRARAGDAEARARERDAAVKRLEAEEARLLKDAEVQDDDLQYLKRLESFTGSALSNLTAQGRLDTGSVVALSRFVMETREAKARAEADLREKLREKAAAVGAARSSLAGPAAGQVHDAVLMVRRGRPGAGGLRLGYLVDGANWTPRYRLRRDRDDGPVVLECLASIVQQSGEDWAGVAVGLSTADPSLDASPPELLPLQASPRAVAREDEAEGADDDVSRRILAELRRPIDVRFPKETPLEDVVKHIKAATTGPGFPEGLPIYIDPIGLNEADKTSISPVAIDLAATPLATTLRLMLRQLGLAYMVRGGVLQITSQESVDQAEHPYRDDDLGLGAGMGGMGGGMGGMGGDGRVDPAPGGRRLNREAAGEQAKELRVAEGDERREIGEAEPTDRYAPTVAFQVDGALAVPSRAEPQAVELARVELPAENYAKAVPVLTPRVYRLAKLTNVAGFPLLPGEVDVMVGGELVGRMRMPLVAAGEPFVAGFGVDPQLQATRRLVRKSRAIQGGNQVLSYEIRIGLRNFRPEPVKFEVWDRIPHPEGESAAVNLVKTSTELSRDPTYQRTARLDNLLRWDVELAARAAGGEALDVDYEFRVEYARDLPPLRFEAVGPDEAAIEGGGMGGGMGGGLR